MKKIGFPIYVTGYLIIIASTILFIINGKNIIFDYNPYIFSIGTLLSITGKYLTLPKSDNFRVKRLNNILAVGAILLVGAAYFMFKGENACIVLITISAFIDLFVSFRYPNEKKK